MHPITSPEPDDVPVEVLAFCAAWAPSCVPHDAALAVATTSLNVLVRRVDVDADARLARAYGVRELPTVVLLRDGVVVDRLEGELRPEKVRAVVRRCGARQV